MAAIRKATGRASSMPAGLVMGALLSLILTMTGSAVLAKLVESEVMEESGIGYGVMVMLILSAFAGAIFSFRKIKRHRLLVCMASGGIYFGILLSITALFFDGQYRAVGVTALLILCGSFLAVLPGFQEKRGGKRPKIKIPNG